MEATNLGSSKGNNIEKGMWTNNVYYESVKQNKNRQAGLVMFSSRYTLSALQRKKVVDPVWLRFILSVPTIF